MFILRWIKPRAVALRAWLGVCERNLQANFYYRFWFERFIRTPVAPMGDTVDRPVVEKEIKFSERETFILREGGY